MRLVHYSGLPIETVYACEQKPHAFKPKGLWVSDDDAFGWREWCVAEEFGLDRQGLAYEIQLAGDARILFIRTADALDDFTRLYREQDDGYSDYCYRVDWLAVAQQWQGIVITPYLWERRMTDHTFWYYGWDCASGCIWDPAAIASVKPLDGARTHAMGVSR